MKILAFAGSNSSQSINKKLVEYTLTFFEDHEIRLLDLNDYETPLYSMDREKNEGYSDKIKLFLSEIEKSDVLIVSLAEHNKSYSAAFKNLIDWCSRIDRNVFKEKPMLLMSTSTGDYGGGNVMNAAKVLFPTFKANILQTFSLPSFKHNFKDSEGIINLEYKETHRKIVTAFKEQIGL